MAGSEWDHAIVLEETDGRCQVVVGRELDEPHGLAPVAGGMGSS